MEKDEKKEVDLEEDGYFVIMEDISESICRDAIKWILKHNLKKPSLPQITLVVCSNGGYMDPAFALVDVMKNSSIPIKTVGIGVVASAGLLIFMSGYKGMRVMTPNTLVLSHQYTSGSYGKEHDLFAQKKANEIMSGHMMSHYKKCTGLSEKQIRKCLLPPSDVWLSAKEALELGLCDSVNEIY